MEMALTDAIMAQIQCLSKSMGLVDAVTKDRFFIFYLFNQTIHCKHFTFPKILDISKPGHGKKPHNQANSTYTLANHCNKASYS